jgi:protease-4
MQMIQAEVDVTYDQFLSRVAEGRKLTKEQVNVIARGRVWTGRDALEIGLVDEIGGLTDAISYAAKKADIKDKRVLYYPLKEEDKFLEIFEDLKDESENAKVIRTEKLPEELLNYYKELKKLEARSGIQMRLPYDVRFY